MKIAVMYSGLLIDDFIKYYENHKQYIYDYYDIDFFVATYLYDDKSKIRLENLIKLINPKHIDIQQYSDIYPYLNDIKNTSIKNRYLKDCRPINALSMFYNIKRSFSSINSKNNYQIFIRNRFDIKYNSKLILQTNDSLNVPAGGDYHKGLMDLFAYGSENIMQKYCSIFDSIPQYVEALGIFHPEILLRYHCIKLNISIKRFIYDIFLRNQNFTKSAPCYE